MPFAFIQMYAIPIFYISVSHLALTFLSLEHPVLFFWGGGIRARHKTKELAYHIHKYRDFSTNMELFAEATVRLQLHLYIVLNNHFRTVPETSIHIPQRLNCLTTSLWSLFCYRHWIHLRVHGWWCYNALWQRTMWNFCRGVANMWSCKLFLPNHVQMVHRSYRHWMEQLIERKQYFNITCFWNSNKTW